jgi:hypothetical protein
MIGKNWIAFEVCGYLASSEVFHMGLDVVSGWTSDKECFARLRNGRGEFRLV